MKKLFFIIMMILSFNVYAENIMNSTAPISLTREDWNSLVESFETLKNNNQLQTQLLDEISKDNEEAIITLELTYKEISELQEAVKEASSENDEIKDHLSTAQKAMDNLIEGLNQVSDRLQENNEDLANEIEANYILEEQNAKLEKKLKKWKIFGFSSGGANIVLIALLIILL